jgi:hypothetical protein
MLTACRPTDLNYRQTKNKPPRRSPAALHSSSLCVRLGLYAVAALTRFGLRRFQLETHPLTDCSGQKNAHGVRLPSCGFHQFLEGRAVRRLSKARTLAVLLPSRAPALLHCIMVPVGRENQ